MKITTPWVYVEQFDEIFVWFEKTKTKLKMISIDDGTVIEIKSNNGRNLEEIECIYFFE